MIDTIPCTSLYTLFCEEEEDPPKWVVCMYKRRWYPYHLYWYSVAFSYFVLYGSGVVPTEIVR
jgi:hypothetical protein